MIPKSTRYKLISKAGIILTAGNKRDMLKARTAHPGTAVWIISGNIGDNLAERYPESFQAAAALTKSVS